MAQSRQTVEREFNNRIAPRGYNRLWRGLITGRFPMHFGDGVVRTVDWNNHVAFISERRNRNGEIVEVKIANAACMNESCILNLLSAQALIASNPRFTEFEVYATASGRQVPANWREVEAFLREQFRQAANPQSRQQTAETEVAATTDASTTADAPTPVSAVAADAPVPVVTATADAPAGTAAMTPVATGDLQQAVFFTDKGLFVRGSIPLPGGGTLNTGSEPARIIDNNTLALGGMRLTLVPEPNADLKAIEAASPEVVNNVVESLAAKG